MTPPMFHHRLLLSLLILLSVVTSTISDVDVDEFSSMLAVLRARESHALFANAIVTSDVALDLLAATSTNSNSSSFTFFAPDDSYLYALDTVKSASEYTSVLRCHIVPQRLTAEDLRRLSNGTSLPTLSGNRAIRISTSYDDVIEVNGVRVVSLGLFYGHRVAVHGLRGILSCTDGEHNSNDVIANNVTEPLQSPAKSPEISSFIVPSPVESPEIGGFVPSPAESPGIGGFIPSPAESPEIGGFIPSPAEPPEIGGFIRSPAESQEIGGFVHGDDLFSPFGVVVDEEKRELEAIQAMSPADLRAVIEFDGDCSAEHGFDLVSYCGAGT